MIDLAPDHKYGLPLSSPVMPAAGTFGYGEAYRDLIVYENLGAIVTNPVSWRSRRAAHGPRLVVQGEHFLVHTGLPNPGVRRVIRRHARRWERLECPVIVHVITTSPADVARVCERLAGVRNVRGIELGLDDGTPVDDALTFLDAARSSCPFPLIVRLPFDGVERLALPLVEAGVDALTLTAPPRGRLLRPAGEASPDIVRGRLYGPAHFPILLQRLAQWGERLPVPLIACGGIRTAEEAHACLDAGATAVQIDALLWRDPRMLARVARTLALSD
jgi:dihydroorotate dehydrogenase (NAD+) catalytic subunit